MTRPLRILHVVSEMGPTGGGVEVWLAHVARRIDRTRFHFDYLVHTDRERAFDAELRALGSRVVPIVRPLAFWRYPFEFARRLRRYGPYDVVHSHVLFGGIVTRLARRAGVPARFAHSHSDVAGFGVDGDPLRGPVVRYTTRWARTDATRRLACSRRAAAAMFGADASWTFVPYGIDLAAFAAPVDRRAVRAELGLAPDVLAVGHVGRFQPQKNHAFLNEVARELARLRPNTRLFIAGDGPLRGAIEQRVRAAGLTGTVTFLGVRHDVPRLFRGAFDRVVLPSVYEGLPLVGLEAQAAGVPLLATDSLAEELDVVPGLVRRLPLSASPLAWAEALAAAAPEVTPASALAAMRDSPFELGRAVRALEAIYDQCATAGAAS
jgi:glycosyltransferase involved in cell wall biosynthesis